MRETKTFLRNIFYSSLALMLLFCPLESLEKSIEFYSENNLPSFLESFKNQGDQTSISVQNWPKNARVTITESKPNHERRIFAKDLDPSKQDVFISVGSIGYIPGEEVLFTFHDLKNDVKEEITIIPYRIYAKSKTDGAEIEAKAFDVITGIYNIHFTGFKKNEKLAFISNSYDEYMDLEITPTTISFLPAVIGKKGGVAKILIKRPSGEVLRIDIPWGIEVAKYALQVNQDGTITRMIDTQECRKAYPGIAEYFDSQKKISQ